MDAAMSTTKKKSHNYVVDGVIQSNTNRALDQTAFIDITKEVPVNQPQQQQQQQQQPLPPQQGFYPNQQQAYYPPQQDIRAQMYGQQQYSYSQPNVGAGPGAGPGGLHTMSMTSQRPSFNGIPNGVPSGNSSHSRSNSLASSASHMNNYLKKKFRKSVGGGSFAGDDDEKDEKGAEFNLVDDTHVSFDDLQHIRGGGRYGSSQIDTTPYIPTLSSKPRGPNGQLSNPQYRKQKMAERKLMAAQASGLPPNGGPRAMSLQSSYQYGQMNPRSMSLQSAGYGRDPRAMSMQGRPPFGNPAPGQFLHPQQQGPTGPMGPVGQNPGYQQGPPGSPMYQQQQVPPGSQSSNLNGMPMKMNNRYSGPAAVGQMNSPSSPQFNRNSPRVGQPQQIYPGANPQMGATNSPRNFSPQQYQQGPGGPGAAVQGRYQQYPPQMVSPQQLQQQQFQPIQPIQEYPDQQSQISQQSQQSSRQSSQHSASPYQNQNQLDLTRPQSQQQSISSPNNVSSSSELELPQNQLDNTPLSAISKTQQQQPHHKMGRKEPPPPPLQTSNSISKRKVNRYVFNDSDNEDDDMAIHEESLIEPQLADTVPTVSLSSSFEAHENESQHTPLEKTDSKKNYRRSLSPANSFHDVSRSVENLSIDRVEKEKTSEVASSTNETTKVGHRSLDPGPVDSTSVIKSASPVSVSTSSVTNSRNGSRNNVKAMSMYSATSSVDDTHYNTDGAKQVYQLAANGNSDVFLTANELLDSEEDVEQELSYHGNSATKYVDAPTPTDHHPPTFYSSGQNLSEGTLKLGGVSPITSSVPKDIPMEAPPSLDNNSRSFSFSESFDDTYNSIGKTPENTLIQDTDNNRVTDSSENVLGNSNVVDKSKNRSEPVSSSTASGSEFGTFKGGPSPSQGSGISVTGDYSVKDTTVRKKSSVMDLVAKLNKKSSVEEFGKLTKQSSSSSFGSGYGKLRKSSTNDSFNRSISSNAPVNDQFSKSAKNTPIDDKVNKSKKNSIDDSFTKLSSNEDDSFVANLNKTGCIEDGYTASSASDKNSSISDAKLEKSVQTGAEFSKSHKKSLTLESFSSYKDTDSPLPPVPMKKFDPVPEPVVLKNDMGGADPSSDRANGKMDLETLTSPKLADEGFNARETIYKKSDNYESDNSYDAADDDNVEQVTNNDSIWTSSRTGSSNQDGISTAAAAVAASLGVGAASVAASSSYGTSTSPSGGAESSRNLSGANSFDRKYEKKESPENPYENKAQPEIPEERVIRNPVFDSSFGDSNDSNEPSKSSPPALPYGGKLPKNLNKKSTSQSGSTPAPVLKDTSDTQSIPPLPHSKFDQSVHDSLTETMRQQNNNMFPSLPSSNGLKSSYTGSPQLNGDGSSYGYQLNSATNTPDMHKGAFPNSGHSDQRPHITSNALSPSNIRNISHASHNSVSSRRKPPPIDTSSPVVRDVDPGFSTPTAFTTPVNAPEPGHENSFFSSHASDSRGAEGAHSSKKSHMFGFNRSAHSQEHHHINTGSEESNGSMFNKLTKKNRSNSEASDPAISPKLGKKKSSGGGFLKKLGLKNAHLTHSSKSEEIESNDGYSESTSSQGRFSSSGSTKRSNFFKPSNLSFKKREDEVPPLPEKSLPVTPSSVDDALYNYRLTISLPNAEHENDDVRFSRIVDMNQLHDEEPGSVVNNTNNFNFSPVKKPSALGISTTTPESPVRVPKNYYAKEPLKLNDSNDSFDFGATSPTGGRSSFAAGLSSALEEQVLNSRSNPNSRNVSKEKVFSNPLVGTDKLTIGSISSPIVNGHSDDATPIVNSFSRDTTPKVNQSSSWSRDITPKVETPKSSFTKDIPTVLGSDPFKKTKSVESKSVAPSYDRSASSTVKKYGAATAAGVAGVAGITNVTGDKYSSNELDYSKSTPKSSPNLGKTEAPISDSNSTTPVNNDSRSTSQKAFGSSPTLQRVFTPEQLGMLHANSQLLNELQIVSNELAESISRELKLEDHIKSNNLVQASVIDSSHRAGEISKLASQLVDERKKRRRAEELLLRQSSGSGAGVDDEQLKELSYENSGLKNQITDLKDTLHLHRSTVDMLRVENDELKEKLDSLTKSHRSLTNETIPQLKNQLEILEFTSSYEHSSEDYELLHKENEQLKKQLSEIDDVVDLQNQKDSLREALKNLKQQRESETRVSNDKIKSLEAKISELTSYSF